MLDIKRLQYLEAVYRHRNFTKASEELFVTQPAISTGISLLEQELDTKLIRRNAKQVVFTEEGEAFIPHARQILLECGALKSEMERLAETKNRTLRLGISPTLGGRLLPLLYAEFFPHWPDAELHISEGTMDSHINKIRNGILDISYNALPSIQRGEGLRLLKITTAEICVIMNPKHHLTGYARIPIEALVAEPLVMLDESAKIRRMVDREFRSRGLTCHVVSSHEQISSMLNMVNMLNAVGFINADICNLGGEFSRFDLRPLEKPIYFDAGFILCAGVQPPQITQELICFVQRRKDAL